MLLTERMFGLGGLATLGLIVVYLPICDGMGRQVCHGIAEELLRLSIRHGWEDRYPSAWLEPGMEAKRRDQRFEVQYNGQVFAVLMEQLLRESGVEILYGTSVCGVAKSGDVIDGIFIENKSGRQFIRGRAFVDATGDADLCALAGEETVVNTAGNPLAAWYYETIDGEYKLRVFGVSDLVRPGEEAPAISSARFVGLDGRELSEMVCSSHEKSLEDHLKKGGVSRRHALSTLASIPMIRMTRRLRGIHELGEQEAFTHFQDSIGMVSDWRKAGPVYEVPFSALHGKHCRNLAVAGRCVSAAGDMWDIMRVIPPCAVTGQAAGLAASISADLPQIDIELLQQKLRVSGVKLHTDELEPLAERQQIQKGTTMKGCYFLGDQKFEIRELPEHPLAPDEVLIKVAACGVCGTDVHIYHGSKGSAEVHPPVVLGHEFSGIIVQTGTAVDRFSPGDHVTVDPNIYCGECSFCRRGQKQLCQNLQAIGVTRNGGFAEYCYAPQQQCFLLSDSVPLRHGAMAEPLACCLHGIDRAEIRPGDTVCVIGGGAIGLMMVQLARMSGASRIVLSEPVSYRREIGLQLGADHAVDPTAVPLPQQLQQLLGTAGADIVIECVGNTIATAQAMAAAKPGATILLFSVPKTGTVHPLSLDDVYQKELRIVGSKINPDTHQRAVDLINSGRLQFAPLITHSYPVEQTEAAILRQMADDSIKVVVEP